MRLPPPPFFSPSGSHIFSQKLAPRVPCAPAVFLGRHPCLDPDRWGLLQHRRRHRPGARRHACGHLQHHHPLGDDGQRGALVLALQQQRVVGRCHPHLPGRRRVGLHRAERLPHHPAAAADQHHREPVQRHLGCLDLAGAGGLASRFCALPSCVPEARASFPRSPAFPLPLLAQVNPFNKQLIRCAADAAARLCRTPLDCFLGGSWCSYSPLSLFFFWLRVCMPPRPAGTTTTTPPASAPTAPSPARPTSFSPSTSTPLTRSSSPGASPAAPAHTTSPSPSRPPTRRCRGGSRAAPVAATPPTPASCCRAPP